MATATATYTREEIESIPQAWNRPTVRCRYDCDFIDEDGHSTAGIKETTGQITIDGNNPWIVIHAGGRQLAERFSWGLVLEAINDRFAAPIHFNQRVEYEV